MPTPKVYIGVGHGGIDAGAVANGIVEKDANLVTSLALRDELERHGVETLISREDDRSVTIAQKTAECNAFSPDLSIEVHYNAGGGDGFEIYRQANSYKNQSLSLSQCLESRVKEIGQNSRGIKTKLSGNLDYFGMLRDIRCPSVLVEGAFLDNKTDVQIIDTTAEQMAIGVAYAKGILDYLGIVYNPIQTQPDAPAVMWGVAKQVIALSSKEKAQEYAAKLNAQSVDGAYYKVTEIRSN